MTRELSTSARSALWVAFGVITLLDVLCFRGLIFRMEADTDVVKRAVFERDAGRITARPVPWHYSMVPHPDAFDARSLLLPPGYPMLLEVGQDRIDAFDLRIYEEPAVALVLARPRGEVGTPWRSLELDGEGTPILTVVGDTPPPIARSAAVGACFDNGEGSASDRVYSFASSPGGVVVTAGRCRWEVGFTLADVVVTSQASARLEMSGHRDIGTLRFELWVLLLVLLGSLLTRWALANVAWLLTDAVATMFVLAVSFYSPVWVLIWALKACFGAAVALYRIYQEARRSKRWRVAAVFVGGAGAVAALVVEPADVAAWYTDKNADAQIEAMRSVDDREALDLDHTTHLVLGYSTVNAAAAGRGAYGSAALDGVLQGTCGEGRRFARDGVDGANICLMADRWTQATRDAKALDRRIFVGGFNDDIAPSLRNLKAVIPSVLALMPGVDPFPSVEASWSRTAMANVTDPTVVGAALSCLRAVAEARTEVPFTYVYDLGIFDLGRPRAHGRAAWEKLRSDVVEQAGGTYIDLRDLLPGESLVYFNDFVHPSEVGYELLARALCEHLSGPRSGPGGPW